MTLGQRIQAERRRLGLSQEGLGEALGVTRQAVSKWEADGAVPDTDKLIALSRLFGLTLNELLQVEQPPEDARPAPAEESRSPEGVTFSAILTVPNTSGTLSVGVCKDGREYLQRLSDYGPFYGS